MPALVPASTAFAEVTGTTGTLEKLAGEVEVEETYVGGRARNMHKGKRRTKWRGKMVLKENGATVLG